MRGVEEGARTAVNMRLVDFYYDIKGPLCDIVIEAAEEWARITGWQMAASSALG